jgi:hypothetical protein
LKDIVLYCKTYRKDFLRLKNLLASIAEFNSDQIPFYISTPQSDYADLIKIIGDQKNFIWVSDEEIIAANPNVPLGIQLTRSGSLAQQSIKSEFWRLGICQNYVCLDADCLFIKNFSRSDFLAADGNPYTVIYQNKEYYQLAINRGRTKVFRELSAEGDAVKSLFGRIGPNYYCPCPPFIWSSKVWASLDERYLKPKNLTFWDVSTKDHPETLLYLEALLNFKAIPLYPIEQLFRIYYYDWHYFLLRRMRERISKLTQNYLGVIYQSNWSYNLDYGTNKSLVSLLNKRIKRALRHMESFF